MSSQPARLWEAVLAALDSLADGGNPSSESQLQDSVLYKNVWKSLGKVSCVPNSTWKRLVLDMQLPRKLGVFASSRLLPLPYASGAELPTAFAEVLSTFLLAAVTEEHEASAQVKAAILQQWEESGLLSSLDALAEATAQQLEQCLAAAAAAAEEEGAKGLHFARRVQLLTTATARQLFIQEHLDYLTEDSGPGPHTLAASNVPAITHLTLTGMRHLSWCLQLLDQPPEQQQQQQPPDAAMRLAGSLSISMVRMATVASFATGLAMAGNKQWLPDAPGDLAHTMGGHFLMWADLALLLVTYGCAFDQHGHLPAVDDFSRRRPAAAAAAAAAAATVSSSSSSNRGLRLGQAAWQLAQGQWQHVPASHEQLLELFGVSTQAAVYVAALMPTCGQELPVASACFLWNPHIKAAQMRKAAEKSATDGRSADAAYTPRQLQQWTDPALAELLQPVLLYGAAHAVPEDEEEASAWIQNCKFTITRVKLLAEAGNLARAAVAAGADLAACSPEQAAAALADHGETPLPVTVRDDSLLLTVTLLQQLQQLRGAGAASNSSGGGGSTAAPTAISAAVAEAEEALVLGLEFLSSDLELALSKTCQGAASRYSTAAWPSCLLGKLALPAAACAADTEQQAAVPAGTACATEEQAAAAAELVAVWQQHLRAVYRALEGFVRAQDTGSSLSPDTQGHLKRITDLCCTAKSPDAVDQPHLLLALARRGSSEQQAAFFSLLVSLLKVSGRGTLDPGSRENSLMLVAGVAAAAYSMVMQTTLPAAGNDDSSSRPAVLLWWRLLGRCFLQWAAGLQELQRQGACVLQVEQQSRERQWQLVDGSVVYAQTQAASRRCAFDMLHHASAAGWVAELLDEALGQHSSLCADLSAAGYDAGPIVQGFKALNAYVPQISRLLGQPFVVVSERVGELIKALASVGESLSVFAVRHCCNNPHCINTCGLTERAIVSGKGCWCARCKFAHYCCKACQTAHWKPAHKPVCKMLRARSAEQS